MTDTPERDLMCDHCGKPECKHVQIVGAGKVCPAACFTFSTTKSARIEALLSRVDKLEEAQRFSW